MKKLLLICLVLLVAVFPNSGFLSAVDSKESSVNIYFISGSNKYFVADKEFEMDSECVNRNSRTFIVARYLTEALGGEISWDSELRTVNIDCRRHKISLQIDNPIAKVDGIDSKIDSDEIITPFIYKDRTLVPIRFISESLGGDVSWMAETKKVRLNFTKRNLKISVSFIIPVGSNWIREGKIREGLTDLGFDFYDHGYNKQGLTLPSGKRAGISYDVPVTTLIQMDLLQFFLNR
ncbi:MAG: stalk domain-containing protein [Caldisericia bacterium]